ncbi:MAG: flagellar export protein FliJ, partial [Lentilitoribacter sp.]
MKSRESQTRLKQFQVAEKTRQLNGIQIMMAEMEKMVAELEYQVASEEKKLGMYDPS